MILSLASHLAVCQMVLDAVVAQAGIADNEQEVELAASMIIELYQQGVTNPDQLLALLSNP